MDLAARRLYLYYYLLKMLCWWSGQLTSRPTAADPPVIPILSTLQQIHCSKRCSLQFQLTRNLHLSRSVNSFTFYLQYITSYMQSMHQGQSFLQQTSCMCSTAAVIITIQIKDCGSKFQSVEMHPFGPDIDSVDNVDIWIYSF